MDISLKLKGIDGRAPPGVELLFHDFMDGGAWPFLVRGVICLQQQVRDALRCSGLHTCYNVNNNKLLKLLILNKEFLVNVNHNFTLITSLPFVHTARRSYRLDNPMKFLDYFLKIIFKKWKDN
ncbi:hypothetical protein M0811_14356 [Anaeramoeba ignava]|uniref:Uncharacterized protein n=2 Tax=Anaeramoeba ignava TaxID=1746090 RepID=A0A9Q0LXD9_ANAIG|nr:hypothetical protein M0811_14356 [Anaeramoeba ignava]